MHILNQLRKDRAKQLLATFNDGNWRRHLRELNALQPESAAAYEEVEAQRSARETKGEALGGENKPIIQVNA